MKLSNTFELENISNWGASIGFASEQSMLLPGGSTSCYGCCSCSCGAVQDQTSEE